MCVLKGGECEWDVHRPSCAPYCRVGGRLSLFVHSLKLATSSSRELELEPLDTEEVSLKEDEQWDEGEVVPVSIFSKTGSCPLPGAATCSSWHVKRPIAVPCDSIKMYVRHQPAIQEINKGHTHTLSDCSHKVALGVGKREGGGGKDVPAGSKGNEPSTRERRLLVMWTMTASIPFFNFLHTCVA